MAANDVSCAASEMPWMVPVSWTGKNPLGMAAYMAAVAPKVSSATIKVGTRWSSTQPSQRP